MSLLQKEMEQQNKGLPSTIYSSNGHNDEMEINSTYPIFFLILIKIYVSKLTEMPAIL